MLKDLYPTDWKARQLACLIEATWHCQHCGVLHGTFQRSRRTGLLHPVYLHAAHQHQDIDNPHPDLIALCPACHMTYDRQAGTARCTGKARRRRGYAIISVAALSLELARVGLLLSEDEESGRVCWHCAGLSGQAPDPLAAVAMALHFLQGELRETSTAYEPVPNATRLPVVCLCGSTRFMHAFEEANLRETLAGKIVLTVGCNTKSDAMLGLGPDVKDMLDDLHRRKIDMADEILVLNVDGYVGPSTEREIAYARQHGKRVRWLVEGQA